MGDYIKTIVILILVSLEWRHSNIKRSICSKDKSRLVRKIILSKWNPILDKYNVKFPLECPINFLREIFWPSEFHKNRNRPTQWTCKLCGKSFFQEKFIDEHMENRHNHLKNWAEDATCLANYCDIMRCDVFESKESLIKVENNEIITDIEVWEDISFQNALAQSKNEYFTKSSLETKKSLTILKNDHASRIPGVTTELPYHTRKLCLANNMQNQNFDKKGNINSNLKSNSQKSSSNDNEDESTSSPNNNNNNTNNNTNDNITVQQKIKNNCKADELEKLKLKCQSLVRTCTIGLLLQMSDFSYKAMEDELNNAVCWYLTCDRYFEDGPLTVQSLPWILIIIVIIIFSMGICFCYYIIWILFDLEEKDKNYYSTDNYNDVYSKRNDNYHNTQMPHYMNDDNSHNSRIQSQTSSHPPPPPPPDSRDLANNDHYIYVTYPLDLKKRLLEKY